MHHCTFSLPVPPFPEASWLAKAYRYDSRSCQTSLTGKTRPKQGHSHLNLNHVFLSREDCCETSHWIQRKALVLSHWVFGQALLPTLMQSCVAHLNR